MTKVANIFKHLQNVQCLAIESFVVFLESVANFFLPNSKVLEISFGR